MTVRAAVVLVWTSAALVGCAAAADSRDPAPALVDPVEAAAPRELNVPALSIPRMPTKAERAAELETSADRARELSMWGPAAELYDLAGQLHAESGDPERQRRCLRHEAYSLYCKAESLEPESESGSAERGERARAGYAEAARVYEEAGEFGDQALCLGRLAGSLRVDIDPEGGDWNRAAAALGAAAEAHGRAGQAAERRKGLYHRAIAL